jgi:hypothetical protein
LYVQTQRFSYPNLRKWNSLWTCVEFLLSKFLWCSQVFLFCWTWLTFSFSKCYQIFERRKKGMMIFYS